MGFLRSFKRKMKRKGQTRKIRRKPFIEMLEPRILLSAESLVHAAAAADNALDLKLQLDDVTEELQLIDTMDQSLVQSQDFASTTEVVITGAEQDDTLIIDMDPSVSLPIDYDGVNIITARQVDQGSWWVGPWNQVGSPCLNECQISLLSDLYGSYLFIPEHGFCTVDCGHFQ